METKVCSRCKVEKPLAAFYVERRINGHSCSCKACEAERKRDKAFLKRFREKQRDNTAPAAARGRSGTRRVPGGRRCNCSGRQYAENYPERMKARWAVVAAIKSGELVRLPCELCGKDSTVAHHHVGGYDKPLDVEWLCAKCHGAHPPRAPGCPCSAD